MKIHDFHSKTFGTFFRLYAKKWQLYLLLWCFPFLINAQQPLAPSTNPDPENLTVLDLLLKADTTQSAPLVLRYLLQAQNQLEKSTNPKYQYETYTRIGKIYQSEGLHNRALPFFQKAFGLPSPPITEKQKKELLTPLAETYFELGSVDSSLLMYDELISYFEKNNNYEGKLKTIQRKVNLFAALGSYRQALDYNLQIKLLAEEKNDQKHLAIIYNNIGYNFNQLKEYDKALQYFLKSLKYHMEDLVAGQQKTTDLDLAVLQTNLGIVYNNLDDPKNAIKFLLAAQKSNNAPNSKITDAYLEHLIATIHLNHGDVYDALKFNNSATNLSKNKKEHQVLKDTYLTAAKIQEKLYDFELALDFYQKHLAMRDSFELEDRFRRQQLLQQQLLLEKSEKEIRLLLVNEEIKDKEIAALQVQQRLMQSEAEKITLESAQQQQAYELLKSEQAAKEANLRAVELQRQRTQQDLVIVQQRLIAQQREREVQQAKAQEEIARMQNVQAQAERIKAEQEAELNKKNLNIAELQLQQQESFRQFAYGLGALGLLLLIMIMSGLYYSRVANRRLAAKNKEIEEEQRKAEKLLLNILPVETANELKSTGVATPKQYEKVTVLFGDFSDFTKISEKLTPDQLINELNDCFRAFDEITEKYGLEKIKTIGDGYMCAGGIPIANDTNPTDAIRAAVEMQTYMKKRYQDKITEGLPYWNMRIGIHTGHVIAGVVGTKKFAYDIWGDTVNIASRMESACENGKINISARTREFINGEFDCTYRGEVEVKHAIKVGMYFVDANLS